MRLGLLRGFGLRSEHMKSPIETLVPQRVRELCLPHPGGTESNEVLGHGQELRGLLALDPSLSSQSLSKQICPIPGSSGLDHHPENGFWSASALTWGCALFSIHHADFCLHAFGSCVSQLIVLPSPTIQRLTASAFLHHLVYPALTHSEFL